MPPQRVRRVLTPIAEFLRDEAAGGVVLLAAAGSALVWVNVSVDSYRDVWEQSLRIGIGNFSISEDLRHWVNDGLMAVFFFVVGLEIKRELVRGELNNPKTAGLPVIAAVGGMVVPAAIYLAINAGGAGSDGWGIPMATDIAFAVGILTVLRSRCPVGLKLFLLTLAIVDDIGAILVIAFFYSHGISFAWMAGAVAVVAVVLLMPRLRIDSPLAYVLPALVLWVCVFESGMHATIAGVALGLLTPAGQPGDRPTIEALEHWLHPVSSFAVIPLFALANAGVVISISALGDVFTSRIGLGIILGLVVGKTLGITGASLLALRLKVGRLPAGVHKAQVLGAGALGGIGFTVSIFVADLSFTGARLDEAKLGILTASVFAACTGALFLVFRGPRRRLSRRRVRDAAA
ncbi:MAG: Na+/H+ antiporter NhaA [Acidimicrobiia bacterium]